MDFLPLIATPITARLTAMATPLHTASAPWLGESDFDLRDFRAQVERDTDLADYPHAVEVRSNVLVYSAPAVARIPDRRALQAELIRALSDGRRPGVHRGVRRRHHRPGQWQAFFAIIEGAAGRWPGCRGHFR